MTEIEPVLSGSLVPAGPIQDDRDGLLVQLTAAWLRKFASEHTRTSYERDLRYWLAWCQGCGLHPLDVRMADVDGWIAYQREAGVQGDGRPAARRSIARRVSVVSSWYTYLLRNTAADPEPLIRHNPADTDARPDVDKDDSPTVGLSRAEADRLIAAADEDSARSSAIIRLMLTNAIRCDIVSRAKITDLGHDRGHRTITMPVKGGSVKRAPLPPSTAHAIDDYLATRGNPAEGLLFVTRSGGQFREFYLWTLVRRLARRAGLAAADQLSPHSLRHTAITEALEATGNLALAQDLAGHADPRTTRLYDRRRGRLDGHAAYVLGTRYGVRDER